METKDQIWYGILTATWVVNSTLLDTFLFLLSILGHIWALLLPVELIALTAEGLFFLATALSLILFAKNKNLVQELITAPDKETKSLRLLDRSLYICLVVAYALLFWLRLKAI